MSSAPDAATPGSRRALRQQLRAERERFAASDDVVQARAALARHLADVMRALEPQCLGVYWAFRSEFNAAAAIVADASIAKMPLAVPFCRRTPVEMHYRAWDGIAAAARDECGLVTSDGEPVLPDVLLVPCLGFTRDGYRLGYGGGYFDRWLALHAGVTAVGVAWTVGEIEPGAYEPQAHDMKMTLIVTERGVV